MVDVIDTKVMPPESALSGMPSRGYNEKSSKLGSANTSGSL